MPSRSLVASICVALLLPFAAHAQEPKTSQAAQATLSISCDADCTWNVDGDQHGALKKEDEAHLNVLFGAHSINATSSDGKLWEEVVEVKQSNQQITVSFAPPLSSKEGQIRSIDEDKGLPTKNSTGEIPKFYSESRQVILQAEVWNKGGSKFPFGSWAGAVTSKLPSGLYPQP